MAVFKNTQSSAPPLHPWPADGIEGVERCPICGGVARAEEHRDLSDETPGAAPGLWNLQRCSACRSAYLDPRPTRDTISLAYANYYTHAAAPGSALRSDRAWLRRAIINSYRNRLFESRLRPSIAGGWILASLFRARAWALCLEGRGVERLTGRTTRRVLDVGCGNGEFLSFARALGCESYGVEPDPAAAAAARSRGATVLGAHVADLVHSHAGSFDAITASHIVEHVHDPTELLRHCKALLKPEGHLWLETPNIDSVGHELYGRHWRGLEPPRHLVIFNASSLDFCLRQAGFSGVRLLEPRDASPYMFTLSASAAAGERRGEAATFSADQAVQVRQNVRRARRLVHSDPTRSEFLTVVALSR